MRRKPSWLLTCLAILACVLVLSRISFTQSPKRGRIVGAIGESSPVWLEGNRRRMFQPENDQGPVEDSFKLENINLVFKPTEEQQANLAALLDAQQDPSSPLYHHWLTPEQFADSFGLSPGDVAQVVAWLQSQGFTITQTARSRLWVSFTGTAAQVRSAFHTEIHYFSVNGKTYYANASEPAVPDALADMVLGFTALDNYGPKPRGVFRQVGAVAPPSVSRGVGQGPRVPERRSLSLEFAHSDSVGASGPEGRQRIAHGVSRGYEGLPDATAPEGRQSLLCLRVGLCRPSGAGDVLTSLLIPRLTPWAIFCRRFAAVMRGLSTREGTELLTPGITSAEAGARVLSSSMDSRFRGNDHAGSGLQPEFTSYLSGNDYLSPGDFATIYDLNPLYKSTTPIDGTGQSIAVMGQTDLYNDGSGAGSDIVRFRSVAGLPAINLTQKLIPGLSDPGVRSADISEASLDVEWSGAVAKNATIYFVNGGANGVYSQAFPYAIDHNIAPVITVSYGDCEANWGSANLQAVAQLAEQANSQGITIMAAAGDSGAADCDYSTSTSVVTSATHGLAVDAPASLLYVTGMGGAELNEGSGAYWQTTTSAGGDIISSALSYIPEKAWNDTSATNGLLAGGGGASSVFPKPSWQTGTGVPNDNARHVPDVSLHASSVHDGYLICVQGSCVNGFRNPNSTPVASALTVAGGTSAATPTFAGIVALINQSAGPGPTGFGQGNINPTLYSMALLSSAGPATAPAAFHDITTGNNIVPCTSGTKDCPTTTPFQFGYSAGSGYDQATGLGSVDAYNLVMAWGSSGAGNLPAPTLSAPANGATSVPLTQAFNWSAVTGNVGYRIMIATSPASLPTIPTTSTCSACVLIDTTPANTTSYTPPANTLASNTLYYWQVQALASSGSAAWSSAFVFNTGNPDFSLSVSPSTLTVSPGGSSTSTLTVKPLNNLMVANVSLTCSVGSTLAGVTCTLGTINGNDGTATVTITASSAAKIFPAPPRNHFHFVVIPANAGIHSTLWLALLAAACLLLAEGVVARTCPLGPALNVVKDPRLFGAKGTKAADPGETGLRYAAGGSRRASLRYALLAAALVALLAACLSCGGGSSGGGGTITLPSESGTITITGTGPTTTHTTQISVSVS